MKTILFIHHYGGLGGAGKSLLNNVQKCSEFSNVVVIVPKEPSDILKLLMKIRNVHIRVVDFVPSIPVYNGGFSAFSLRLYLHLLKSYWKRRSFINLIKSISPDLIISNSLILSWVSLIKINAKKICFIRETKANSIIDRLHSKCLKYYDEVIFISKYDRDSWALKNNVDVLYNSVLEPNPISGFPCNAVHSHAKKDLSLLYLGGTSNIKGFWFLLYSLRRMKNKSSVHLFVLGELKDITVRLACFIFGKKLNVSWIGKTNDVDHYYRICDVVVFPVVKVHQGRPIFEAGAFKKAAIVPDFPNLMEFVEHERNGLVYNRHNKNSLTILLDEISEGLYDLRAIGVENHNFFLYNHTVEHANSKLFNIVSNHLI